MTALAFALIALAAAASPAVSVTDRSRLYPPPAGTVLAGRTAAGDPAVLWWEQGRLYNTDPLSPQARDHYDLIDWRGDWLEYAGTVDPEKTVTYSPPIRYLPRTASPPLWSGESAAVVSRRSELRCVGVDRWAISLHGDTLTVGESTEWLWGSDPSGCRAGYTTEWWSTYTFGPGGLVRTTGGNLTGADSWDITFGAAP